MDRKFGIEIEGFNVPMAQVAQVVSEAGVACQAQGYNHTTQATWKVVTDGSIQGRYGFELVSPILSGENGFAQVRSALNAIAAAGAQVNRTTGFHVHVNARDLNLATIKQVVKMWLYFEDAFDAVQPDSRRGNANVYCRSNLLTSDMVSMFRLIDEATSLDQIARAYGSRYFKLNLQAFFVHGTIEFRHHAGTVDAEKVISWVKLILAMIEKATVAQIRPRKAATATTPRRSLGELLVYIQASAEVAAYYRRRFQSLNPSR